MVKNARDDTDEIPLNWYELPPELVKPAVSLCRYFNTMLDATFYDVFGLANDLHAADVVVATSFGTNDNRPSRILDLSALANPEGCLLLIDTTKRPYVHRFDSVEAFLESSHPETREVEIATITGVGSSALGSAAMGWNVSKALASPVLAIVPGYGLADMVLQGLGGWFGFGLHDWLGTKPLVQTVIASVAPRNAKIGRQLTASAPETKTINGAPVFRYGSGSSDVLHALIRDRASPFKLLVGHSKGALQIGNAVSDLDPEKTQDLRIVTLGCPVRKSAAVGSYAQYLGMFDVLGQLNMWGNLPSAWVPTWHTTNPWLPPAMHAGALAAKRAA